MSAVHYTRYTRIIHCCNVYIKDSRRMCRAAMTIIVAEAFFSSPNHTVTSSHRLTEHLDDVFTRLRHSRRARSNQRRPGRRAVSPACRAAVVGRHRRRLARALDGEPNEDVQDDDESHWEYEEHERWQLQQHAGVGQPLGRHGADERVVQRTAVAWVTQVEVGACEERVRGGSHGGRHPDADRRLKRT